MRGLTSRSVRPCLRHYSIPSSLPPVRRTILPPARRVLTAADAFAILLAPVLTAAFVLDVTAKQDRSQEWDRQIAAVEEESEQLRQRQLEAWSRIQHRSVRHGAYQQRRSMSTAAVGVRNTLLDDDLDPLDREEEIMKADGPVGKNNVLETEGQDPALHLQENCRNQARYERLIATRLALQFLVQIRTSRTNWGTVSAPVSPTSSSYGQSMDYLVSELEKVSLLLHQMQIHTVPFGTNIPSEDIPKKMELGDRLSALLKSYKQSAMHLPDFVMSYVQLIAEFKLGPPITSYVEMMRVFSNHTQNSSMAAMCETALWESHQFLNSYHLANILFRHGSDADSGRMYELLTRIQKKDSFPRSQTPWQQLSVNDINITVPANTNSYLMTNLMRSALCNQQQNVAEAYATVLLERDPIFLDGRSKSHMVSCFLQSYGTWGSWRTGQRWLQTAIAWAHEFVEFGSDMLGRVVLRMLDFCVACDKQDEYEMILDAAIASSIPIPSIDYSKPQLFSERMAQIRIDWIERMQGFSGSDLLPSRLKLDHVRHFQDLLSEKFDWAQNIPIRPYHPSDGVVSKKPHKWSRTVDLSQQPAPQVNLQAQSDNATLQSEHAQVSSENLQENLSPITGNENPSPASSAEATDIAQEPNEPEPKDEVSNYSSPYFAHATESSQMSNRRAFSSLAIQPRPGISLAMNIDGNSNSSDNEATWLREKLRLTQQKLLQAEERVQQLKNHQTSVEDAFARISGVTELMPVEKAREILFWPQSRLAHVLLGTEKETTGYVPLEYHDIVHNFALEQSEQSNNRWTKLTEARELLGQEIFTGETTRNGRKIRHPRLYNAHRPLVVSPSGMDV